METHSPIPFVDIQTHRQYIGEAIDEAIAQVMTHGKYIMGPEIQELETTLSDRVEGRNVITCANGTDALHLCLRAFDVNKNDAIFVPAFTFAATAEAICLAGGTPVFVDIDPKTYNISPESLEDSIKMILKDRSLKPTGILSVDLFGQPAAYPILETISDRYNLWILEDAAQALGANLNKKPCGAYGLAGTTSFFPAKPLGAYGDGGAIFVDDNSLADKIRSLRLHGKGSDKYENIHIGMNSRLDTLQAAVLLQKVKLFDTEVDARNRVARRYSSLLKGIVETPEIIAEANSVWAQYTIRTSRRNELMSSLRQTGIPTAIYYPTTLQNLPAYQAFPVAPNGTPAALVASTEVISLPLHPYLTETIQDRIVAEICKFFEASV